MSRNLSGPPDLCPASTPRLSRRQQKPHPVRAFAQRCHHSRASVAHHEQLAIFSMNRAEPSVNVQVRLKYQDYLKNPVELGPGMHHRSAQPRQAADTSAPGQPARTSNARDNPVAWGPGWVPGPAGPRGRRHGRPVAARPRHAGGLRRPGGPARAGSRRRATQRQSACAVTPAVVAGIEQQPRSRIITILFQNRCWVSGPGVEFTGKGGEEPLSGEEGRAPPLECPAVRRPSAGPTWRDAVGSKIKFLGEGGPNDR